MARPRVKPPTYEEKSSEESSNNAENESEGSGEESTGGNVTPEKTPTKMTVPAPETNKTTVDTQAAKNQTGKSPKKPPALQNVAKGSTSKVQATPPSKTPPSEAASSKPKSTKGNAKSVATTGVVNAKKRAQVSANKEESVAKKSKSQEIVSMKSKQANLLDKLDDCEDDEESKEENENDNSLGEVLSVDELIAKAEGELLEVVDYLFEDKLGETNISPYEMILKYKKKVAKLHESEEEKEKSDSPLWKGKLSMQMLHGLQDVGLFVQDILYGYAQLSDAELHPDMQMMGTYVCKSANWLWFLQNVCTHLH